MNETPAQRVVAYLETNDFEEYKKMKQWLGQENHPHSLVLGIVSMAPHTTQTFTEFVLKEFLEDFQRYGSSKEKVIDLNKSLKSFIKIFSVEQCITVAQILKTMLPEILKTNDSFPNIVTNLVNGFVLEVLGNRSASSVSPFYEQLLAVPEKPLTREILINRSAGKGNLSLLERLHSEQKISQTEAMHMVDKRVGLNDFHGRGSPLRTDFFIEKVKELFPLLSRDMYLDFVYQPEKEPYPLSSYNSMVKEAGDGSFRKQGSIFFNIIVANLPQDTPTQHRALLKAVIEAGVFDNQRPSIEEWLVLDNRLRLEDEVKSVVDCSSKETTNRSRKI